MRFPELRTSLTDQVAFQQEDSARPRGTAATRSNNQGGQAMATESGEMTGTNDKDYTWPS
jgi:hypothetical protein